MLFSPYFWLAVALCGAGLYGAGVYKGYSRCVDQSAAQAAKHAEKVNDATDTVVTDYVTPLAGLASADAIGPALAERVCAPGGAGVPSAKRPAPKAAPHPRDELAGEVRNCVANTLQLDALIKAVQANNAH